MSESKTQKSFLSLFFTLVLLDFLAQLATLASIPEMQPLVAIWFGPLDDIFYGMAGVQALYYLIDPNGETRDGPVMTTTATVKKIAALLSTEKFRRAYLPQSLFSGSTRAVLALGNGLVLAVMANGFTESAGLGTLMLILQRHLSYLLPITLAGAAALLWALESRPPSRWSATLGAGFGCLIVSAVYDGRWAHHLHHLLASLSTLQAWGAALCWIAAGASLSGVLTPAVETEPQPA